MEGRPRAAQQPTDGAPPMANHPATKPRLFNGRRRERAVAGEAPGERRAV